MIKIINLREEKLIFNLYKIDNNINLQTKL